MKNIARAGWICACLGLMAPAGARADSVGVMHGAYEASLVRFTPEPEQSADAAKAPAAESLFSLCRRCMAPDASPFLVSNALSQVRSGSDDAGGIEFGGGFAATFGGMLTLPVPGLNSAVMSAMGSTVTMPFPSQADEHHGAAAGSGGGLSASHGSLMPAGLTSASQIAGGALSTGRAALSKAESLAATPEPASLVLLGLGLFGIAGRRAWRAAA